MTIRTEINGNPCIITMPDKGGQTRIRGRVDRLEQAGDLLAEWHLAVVTTVEKAERDVARWNEAKGANR